MRQPQIEYICDKCREPIANGRGFVWLDLDRVSQYKIEARAWMSNGREGRPPLKPRWSAHHAKCVRVREPIQSVRVESVRGLVSLTRTSTTLMETLGNDLALTDWLDMLRYVTYGHGTAWFTGEPR